MIVSQILHLAKNQSRDALCGLPALEYRPSFVDVAPGTKVRVCPECWDEFTSQQSTEEPVRTGVLWHHGN